MSSLFVAFLRCEMSLRFRFPPLACLFCFSLFRAPPSDSHNQLCVCPCVFVYVCVCGCICGCFSVTLFLRLCVSVSLCLSLSLCLCVSLSLCLCVSVSLCLSVRLSVSRHTGRTRSTQEAKRFPCGSTPSVMRKRGTSHSDKYSTLRMPVGPRAS